MNASTKLETAAGIGAPVLRARAQGEMIKTNNIIQSELQEEMEGSPGDTLHMNVSFPHDHLQ